MKKAQDIGRVKALIDGAEHIMLLSHTRPDGDAIGSMGGMYWQLLHQGKQVRAVLESSLPCGVEFIGGGMDLCIGMEKARAAEQWCDLIICTDFAQPSRAGIFQELLESSAKPKLVIDHHKDPHTEKFTHVESSSEVSSACELVYFILRELYPQMCLQAGTCLMCGMTTDTNNFANSVYSDTLTMASELLAMGVDRDACLDKLYHSYRENRIRAFSYFTDKMTILENGVAYIIVTEEEWNRFSLLEGELEGLVNVPLGIGKVKMSIYFREDGDSFRVSVRSKKGVSALEVARNLFHGGGHVQASGGKLTKGEDVLGAQDIPALVEKIVL